MEALKKEAIYLFCLTRHDVLGTVHGSGMDARYPFSYRVFKDIAAVWSPVATEEFCGASAEENFRDLRWIGPRVCRHEEVVEQMMCYSPVFPTRFGTLFSALERLDTLLEGHYGRVADFLDYIADKQEWGIKVLLDRNKAARSFVAAEILTATVSPGRNYLQEKKKRAEGDRKSRDWARANIAEISSQLGLSVEELRPLKVLPREVDDKNQEVVVNWALLVRKTRREDLLAEIKALESTYLERGLTLELSGPWPPYSFCPALEEDGSDDN